MQELKLNGSVNGPKMRWSPNPKQTFVELIISLHGSMAWSPRSCDLTPQAYFWWDYVKTLVHTDKPKTIDAFEENIRNVVANVRPQFLQKVVEN